MHKEEEKIFLSSFKPHNQPVNIPFLKDKGLHCHGISLLGKGICISGGAFVWGCDSVKRDPALLELSDIVSLHSCHLIVTSDHVPYTGTIILSVTGGKRKRNLGRELRKKRKKEEKKKKKKKKKKPWSL